MQYFELILTIVVFICGFSQLSSRFFHHKRGEKSLKWLGSYFPILLFVLLFRAFVFQPFKVVSGSLEPTVLIGDYIAVNQAAYGLRLPVLHTKVVSVGEPKLGDIALFYYPKDTSLVFVKRVIGVPGDHVVYKNKQLTINGQHMAQKLIGTGFDTEPGFPPRLMEKKMETLGHTKHEIFVQKEGGFDQTIEVTVPKGMYFMMGDNRDDSDDSRMWGFVPEKNLIGRAYRVLLSWDSEQSSLRFSRIGHRFFA